MRLFAIGTREVARRETLAVNRNSLERADVLAYCDT